MYASAAYEIVHIPEIPNIPGLEAVAVPPLLTPLVFLLMLLQDPRGFLDLLDLSSESL